MGSIRFYNYTILMGGTEIILRDRISISPSEHEDYISIGRFVFPEAIIPTEDSMGVKGIRIAHWLILLVYTLVWSAILFAWQRYRSQVFKLNQIADLEC